MKNATQEILYSLYVNGRYCESSAARAPYAKGSVLMLPLARVAKELGLTVARYADLGETLVYRVGEFDADLLTIRYVLRDEKGLALYYYMQHGEVLELPPPDWRGDALFVPKDLFETAFGCRCSVSDNGNINLRGA